MSARRGRVSSRPVPADARCRDVSSVGTVARRPHLSRNARIVDNNLVSPLHRLPAKVERLFRRGSAPRKPASVAKVAGPRTQLLSTIRLDVWVDRHAFASSAGSLGIIRETPSSSAKMTSQVEYQWGASRLRSPSSPRTPKRTPDCDSPARRPHTQTQLCSLRSPFPCRLPGPLQAHTRGGDGGIHDARVQLEEQPQAMERS